MASGTGLFCKGQKVVRHWNESDFRVASGLESGELFWIINSFCLAVSTQELHFLRKHTFIAASRTHRCNNCAIINSWHVQTQLGCSRIRDRIFLTVRRNNKLSNAMDIHPAPCVVKFMLSHPTYVYFESTRPKIVFKKNLHSPPFRAYFWKTHAIDFLYNFSKICWRFSFAECFHNFFCNYGMNTVQVMLLFHFV